MPRTITIAQPKTPRRLPGMTYRQTVAFRRIVQLQDELVATMSLFSVTDNAIKLAAIEALVAEHFPADWQRLQAEQEVKVVGVESVTVTDEVEAVFGELEEVAAS